MRLVPVSRLSTLLSLGSDPSTITLLGACLDQATEALKRRLDTDFAKADRLSIFCVTNADLTEAQDTVKLRLGSSVLSSKTVAVRLATSSTQVLSDDSSGDLYTGTVITDVRTGVVAIPKSAIRFTGDYKVTVSYSAGLDVDADDQQLYTNVPEELQQAAIAYATKVYYSTNKSRVESKYNKFDVRVAEQTIKDMLARYERPRALVVFEEIDEVITP